MDIDRERGEEPVAVAEIREAGISGVRIFDADGLREWNAARDRRALLRGMGCDALGGDRAAGVAAGTARAFEMYVPSPRLPGDAQQREWIEGLEQRWGSRARDVPGERLRLRERGAGDAVGEQRACRARGGAAPGLLVGVEWPDQVRLVCAQAMAWVAEHPNPGAPIGVVAPEDSATAIAVAEASRGRGFASEYPGRPQEPALAVLIIEQVARCHLSGHDVAELLELARLLWLYAPAKWSALEPESVRNALDRAFQTAQSRNSRILAQALPRRKDRAWAAAHELVEALGRGDGDLDPPALLEKWEALLAALRLPPDTIDARPDGLFHEERVTGRAFMEWLASHLSARRRLHPPDYAMLAPVVVTTFANAAQQTWERLIFLDSNEHVWPAPIGETAAAPLTRHDLRALEQARFLDLLEHCRGPIAFAASSWSRRSRGALRNQTSGCSGRCWRRHRGSSRRTSGPRARGRSPGPGSRAR